MTLFTTDTTQLCCEACGVAQPAPIMQVKCRAGCCTKHDFDGGLIRTLGCKAEVIENQQDISCSCPSLKERPAKERLAA